MRRRGSGRWGSAGGDKFEGVAVDAVARAGGARSVVEDVAEVTFTAGADVFRAAHAKGAVGAVEHVAGGDGRVETRPAGAGIVLGGGFEKWQVAAGADEGARFLGMEERAGMGAFGTALAEDVKLLRLEALAPLGFGERDEHDIGGALPGGAAGGVFGVGVATREKKGGEDKGGGER